MRSLLHWLHLILQFFSFFQKAQRQTGFVAPPLRPPPPPISREAAKLAALPHDGWVDDIVVADHFPYRIRDDFLSPAESAFYRVLLLAVKGEVLACPKVRLGDIFYCAEPQGGWAASNRINQKHVDFLLCSNKDFRPLAGIELDDKSHRRKKTIARDEFVEAVFSAAGLPLVRIPVCRTYDPKSIRAELRSALRAESSFIVTASVVGASKPTCPKCGIVMVERTAQYGANAGKRFFGCVNFPKCREVSTV